MKLRNFVIVLLAALMVFAFASCNNEPKVNPDPKPSEYEPTDSTVYQIKVTEGVVGYDKHNNRDKLKIEWDETINEGDTITLKFRSERDIFQYDIRNGSDKWVYEGSKNGFEDPVLGDGGWYTLTYTFGAKKHDGTTAMTYPQNHFGIYFRAHFLDNDLFELMDIVLTHVDDFGNETEKELTVTSANVKSSAALVEGFDGEDHIWTIEKNYPVFFVLDTDHDTDEYWLAAQKVKAGGLATPFKKDGYTYRFFKDKGQTEAFDFSTPINEITYIFYEQTANTNTIKFDLNGGSAKEGEADAFADQAVATKGTVVMPEAEPVIAEKLFAAWCTDAAGTKPYDFTTEVTGDLTLYARYDDPIIVTFDKNDGSEDTVRLFTEKVLSGKTVAKPADDPVNGENYFAGWFLGEATESYDFATPVTENITLKAKWMEPVVVTLDPNYKIDEVAVATSTVTIGYGTTMTQPANPAEREGFAFDKWTTDSAGETAYVFGEDGDAVTKAFTLYAQWKELRTITLDQNYDGAPTAGTIQVVLNEVLAADDERLIVEDNRIGSVIVGWYDEKSCTTPHDFSQPVTDAFTLFAKWGEAPLYKLVATGNAADSQYGKDKLAIVHATADVDDGDVLSFRFRTTRDFKFFSIRRAGGGKKWIYQNSNAEANYGFTSYETKADGWTYVIYKFDKATAVDSSSIPEKDADFEIHFGNRWNDPSGNTGIVAGDILEIQDWAINGVPMKIAADDVTSYAGATVSVVEGGSYAWPNHTVKFAMDVADAIDDKTVGYGRTIAKPDDPKVDNYKFIGWFADSLYETEFNFDSPIFEDVTIYAKFEEKSGDTFKVTFNPNYTGAASSVVEVDEGDTVTAIKTGRPGYFLDGWFTAASDGDKVDLSTYTPTADTELFAHWTAPTKKYVLTATIDTDEKVGDDTYNADRFNLRWSTSYTGSFAVGDVVTCKVKSIPVDGSSAVTRSRLRDKYGSNTLCTIDPLSEADEDGWIELSFIIEKVGKADGLSIDFRKASGNLAIGDKLEIMAVALNGKDLTLATDSSSHGVYYGAKPTIEEVSLVL